MSTQKDEDEELKNFPVEMGVADPEGYTDYSELRRDIKDSDVMKVLWNIFSTRLFPVLSLIYISSVMGLSLSAGTHFLFDKSAYLFALVILFWVSLAPFVWILAKAMDGFELYGRAWYFWVAGSQGFCGIIFYLLFPASEESWLLPMQAFFVASLPMHIVIYIFFIKGGLPANMAWPLTFAGIVFMLYGLLFV